MRFLFALFLSSQALATASLSPLNIYANCLGDHICELQKAPISTQDAVAAAQEICKSEGSVRIDVPIRSGSTAFLILSGISEKITVLANCEIPPGTYGENCEPENLASKNPTNLTVNSGHIVKESFPFCTQEDISEKLHSTIAKIETQNLSMGEESEKFKFGFKNSKTRKGQCEPICTQKNQVLALHIKKNKASRIADGLYKNKQVAASLETETRYSCIQCGDPKYFSKTHYTQVKPGTNSCMDKDGCLVGTEKRKIMQWVPASNSFQSVEVCMKICEDNEKVGSTGLCEPKESCHIWTDALGRLNKQVTKAQNTFFTFGTCDNKFLHQQFNEFFQETFEELNTQLKECQDHTSKIGVGMSTDKPPTTLSALNGANAANLSTIMASFRMMESLSGVSLNFPSSFMNWLKQEFKPLEKKCNVSENYAVYLPNDPFVQFAETPIYQLMGEQNINPHKDAVSDCSAFGICIED